MSTTGVGSGTSGGLPAHPHSPFRPGAGFSNSQYPNQQQHHSSTASGQRQAYHEEGGVGGFTPAMRDRQARGRDPYEARERCDEMTHFRRGTRGQRGGRSSSPGWPTLAAEPASSKEPFPVQERRAIAAAVLDSPELLMMHAQSTGDSIPATRLAFTRMLCGYDGDTLDEERNARSTVGSSSGGKKGSTGARRSEGKWQPN